MFIEVDEHQHFTTARALTLDLYPPAAALGFDADHYRSLCAEHSAAADRYMAAKAAVAFGPRGRRRQRAYHDMLRDLAVPAMTGRPVVRVDAVDRDGASAYHRNRDRIWAAVAGAVGIYKTRGP